MNTPNANLDTARDTLTRAADGVSSAVSESSGVVADAAEHVAEAALNAALPFAGSAARYLWHRNRKLTAVLAALVLGVGGYRWWSARNEPPSQSDSSAASDGAESQVPSGRQDSKPGGISNNVNNSNEQLAASVS